ncbi:hypothetical protein FQR65_LT08197 [Abscondita terminalis]|nr:hypothetical protein FQR65_LT08197 [Abscondita terminalis]
MICTSEEFATAFHSVTKERIGESCKQLFLLLKNTDSSAIDLNSIDYRYPLEEKFMVKVLKHFGRWQDLVNLLSCENPTIVKKILRIESCLKFISNFTNEELLLLLSGISYNAKLKLLNKLPLYLDSAKGNSVFNAVLDRYGFYLASKLIPACSTEVILNSLKDVRWKPTTHQLMQIVTKNPDLQSEIITFVIDGKLENCHKAVLNRLGKSHPEIILNVYKNKQPEQRLGRRITRKFLKNNINDIIQNPNQYYNCLHKKLMVRSLGNQFATAYLNMFPTNMDKFRLCHSEIIEILQNLPPKNRDVRYLVDAFSKRYGKNFWDYSEYVTPIVLEMVPTEEREQVLKAEFKGSMSEDQWMCYYPTEKSIPYLKKRITVTSDIKARAELMELLVETCKLNRDKVTLTRICHYMNSKHRNDHYSAYIRFRLNKNLSIEDELREWIKLRYFNFNLLRDTPSYEKRCLIEFGQIELEGLVNENDRESFIIGYLANLADWNKRHPKDPFYLEKYPKMIEFMKKCLESESSYLYSINDVLRCYVKGHFDKDLLLSYFNNSKVYIDCEVLLPVIKMEPRWFMNNVNNIKDIFRLVVQNYRTKNIYWRMCQNYHHVGIPQKLIESCLSKIDEDPEENLVACATGLSYLMPPHDFLQFIKAQYNVPNTAATDQKSPRNLKIEKILGECARNIQISSLTLETVTFFCERSTFKHFYSSLHSILYNVNPERLFIILGELSKHSPLFRKQSLHLACIGLSKLQITNILSNFIANEKNPSVRKCILRNSFKLFTQNPSNESFETFKTVYSTMPEFSDDTTLRLLITTRKVSSNYFVPYTLLCWDLLRNKASTKDKDIFSSEFLKSFSLEQVGLLPVNFCTHIFECLFDNGLASLQKGVQAFTCKLIAVSDDHSILESIFLKLKCFVSEGRLGETQTRSSVFNFVTEFCSLFLEDRCNNKFVFTKFFTLWSNVFKPHDAFDEYVHLRLTLVYLDKVSITQLAAHLIDLCQSLTADYGLVFVNLFYEKLKFFVDYFFNVNKEEFEEYFYVFVENLIQSDRSVVSSVLLGLLLLNERPPTFDSTKEKYLSMLNILQNYNNPVVQIYLNNHLNNAVSV